MKQEKEPRNRDAVKSKLQLLRPERALLVNPGYDQNTSSTNQKTAESKLERTS